MRTTIHASLLATTLISALVASPAFAQTTKRPAAATATTVPSGSAMTDAGIAVTPAPTAPVATPQTGERSPLPGAAAGTGALPGTPAGTAGSTAGADMTSGTDTLGTSTTGTSAAGNAVVTGNTNPTALDHAQAATHANINAAGHAVGTSATVDADSGKTSRAKKTGKDKKQ